MRPRGFIPTAWPFVLTRIEPGGVPPVEGELDESEGEDEEADERRGERREEAESEPIVDPVVGEGTAFGCGRISQGVS